MNTNKKGEENIMDDLKLIKKYYGENMMHLCRELFPTILEKEGLLFNTLSSKFHPYKYIVEDLTKYPNRNDIEIFKEIILMAIDSKKSKESLPKTDKTVRELLDEAGYILYECHSEEDIQRFKKYYAPGEELCTFNGDRLNTHHVFFAVKKNINEIKRENFNNPSRQDEYGTSIISIQFSRGDSNNLSIKNRYNHTVSNPDATFSNNLENIIEGLTYAFEKEYNLHITQNQFLKDELQDYVLADDGKYYRYNYENNNIYYCPDNIIIDNSKVKQYDKSRYILFDEYILDMKVPDNKEKNLKIALYKESEFKTKLDKIHTNIKTLEIINNKKYHTKELHINGDTIITLNKRNSIIGYSNKSIEILDDWFEIASNNELEWIVLPNVKKIGDSCLRNNIKLKFIDLSNVEIIGNYFFAWSKLENCLYLPKCREVGECFAKSSIIPEIDLPEDEIVGDEFLCHAKYIKRIYLPKCIKKGKDFLYGTNHNKEVYAPLLEEQLKKEREEEIQKIYAKVI